MDRSVYLYTDARILVLYIHPSALRIIIDSDIRPSVIQDAVDLINDRDVYTHVNIRLGRWKWRDTYLDQTYMTTGLGLVPMNLIYIIYIMQCQLSLRRINTKTRSLKDLRLGIYADARARKKKNKEPAFYPRYRTAQTKLPSMHEKKRSLTPESSIRVIVSRLLGRDS